jgi:acetyl-CoA carboxylase biotin carboxylase subunit
VFGTVLVANRGEIALRIVRTCRELGLRSVVAHSTVDRDSLAVRLADGAVCVGPGPAARSYRNIPALLYACARAGADALHPGYGFLAEDSRLAAACREVGVTFIGPPAECIALMGDKIAARSAMRAAGVAVVPGSAGALSGPAEAAEVAAEIGYPVLLKAAAGGGGRAIAAVGGAAELAGAWAATSAAAQSLFADDRLYLEKCLRGARHVEIQVLADAGGSVVHLGERDCSVQRRRQKLVEESPSPALDPAVLDQLCATAVRGAQAIGYVSAGTMEFLVDADGSAHFIEMNTRLQVEHPVTEARTGLDLVEWMIRVAAGQRLPFGQPEVRLVGHAIEARINTEDVSRDWLGCSGRITALELPGGPGVRVDSHAFAGYVVPPHYDSLLAKIVVSAPTRAGAVARLERALAEFRCAGVATNVDFHRTLVRTPAFRSGRYQLDIVDRVLAGAEVSANGREQAMDSAVLDKEELRHTVAEVLELEPGQVTDDVRFVEELDVDSLMALEVMVVLERKYGVKLAEDQLQEITCLQRVHDILAEKLGSTA